MSKSLGPQIDKATAYCTYCPKLCRFSCPAAEVERRETVTPWGMMRLLELVKNGAVEPSEEVAETFYHCMGCRRCQNWCNHDNDVPQAMWEARAWMRELGHVPAALQGFSEFFLEENSPHSMSKPLAELDADLRSDDEAIFDAGAPVAWMPDCETRHHFPELVLRGGRLLEKVLGHKVRLQTRDDGIGFGCCGFPLLSAGDAPAYEAYRAELEASLAGVEYVVSDCAAFATLHREGGSWGRASELRVVHLIELLAERLGSLEIEEKIDGSGLMLHDSCGTGRQLELHDATRQVLAAICDPAPASFHVNREDAPCCGAPGHYHVVAPKASEELASRRLEQMEREGGERVVSGQASCTKAFSRVGDGEASTSLLELACEAMGL